MARGTPAVRGKMMILCVNVFCHSYGVFVDWNANEQGFQSATPPSTPACNLNRPTAFSPDSNFYKPSDAD